MHLWPHKGAKPSPLFILTARSYNLMVQCDVFVPQTTINRASLFQVKLAMRGLWTKWHALRSRANAGTAKCQRFGNGSLKAELRTPARVGEGRSRLNWTMRLNCKDDFKFY